MHFILDVIRNCQTEFVLYNGEVSSIHWKYTTIVTVLIIGRRVLSANVCVVM